MSDVIDRLDRHILYEFDVDSRQPLSAIAKAVGTPEETVRYRVRSLKERGAIISTLTVIDAGLLGNNYFKILIKLQSPRLDVVNQIERFLIESDEVNWVARCEILYDVLCTVRVKQISDLNSFVDNLKRKFYQTLKHITFAVNVEVDFLPRDYLIGKIRKVRRKGAYATPTKRVVLDDLDRTILYSLSKDARKSVSSMAIETKCADETIAARILKLERTGVITGYRLTLDCEQCGIVNYYILLYLNQQSPQHTADLLCFIRSQPELSYIIKTIGAWDYELNFEAFDIEAYRDFMGRLTTKFSSLIKHWEAFPVSKVHKLTIAP